MSGVNDEELRERLEAHNYKVPPITATTRGLLHKKLIALDEKNVRSKIGKQCYFNEAVFLYLVVYTPLMKSHVFKTFYVTCRENAKYSRRFGRLHC